MSIELALNPLKIIPGKSLVEPIVIDADWQTLQDKLCELGLHDGYAIFWQINCISWAIEKNGSFSFSGAKPKIELILELRVFNENAEIYLQKQGDKFIGRYRSDESGEETEYVDSASRFWGNYNSAASEDTDGFITLIDKERKIFMKIPKIESVVKHYALETRSYVGINKQTAQAGYTDYRFKAIIPADMKGDDE